MRKAKQAAEYLCPLPVISRNKAKNWSSHCPNAKFVPSRVHYWSTYLRHSYWSTYLRYSYWSTCLRHSYWSTYVRHSYWSTYLRHSYWSTYLRHSYWSTYLRHSYWSTYFRQNIDTKEKVQRRSTKMNSEIKKQSYNQRLNVVDFRISPSASSLRLPSPSRKAGLNGWISHCLFLPSHHFSNLFTLTFFTYNLKKILL